MTKEVTFTTAFMAKMEINEEGLPVAVQLPTQIILGSVTKEKAQKMFEKSEKDFAGTTVYKVESETSVYRMKVEDFVRLAEKVTEDTPEDEDEDEDENTPEPTPEPTPTPAKPTKTAKTATAK